MLFRPFQIPQSWLWPSFERDLNSHIRMCEINCPTALNPSSWSQGVQDTHTAFSCREKEVWSWVFARRSKFPRSIENGFSIGAELKSSAGAINYGKAPLRPRLDGIIPPTRYENGKVQVLSPHINIILNKHTFILSSEQTKPSRSFNIYVLKFSEHMCCAIQQHSHGERVGGPSAHFPLSVELKLTHSRCVKWIVSLEKCIHTFLSIDILHIYMVSFIITRNYKISIYIWIYLYIL